MRNIITPEFRASFPALVSARRNELSGKDEFSVVALFKRGEDLSGLKKACEDALIEKFGPKASWPKGLKTPFRDQVEKARDGVLPPGHESGAIFCTFKTTQKPGIVDGDLHAIIDPAKIYGGCYMKASVRPGVYEFRQNGKVISRGVSLWLQNIQVTRDGEPFGSPRVQAMDEFAPVNTNTNAEDDDVFGRM